MTYNTFSLVCLSVMAFDVLFLNSRVIELLTQNWTFSSFLRVPAVSRLQVILLF